MTNTKTLAVADTILAQLGGSRFLAMTGAKNLLGDENSLLFSLPRGAKDGVNKVSVVLADSDTYVVTFYKQGRAPSYAMTTVREVEHVHADQLRAIFTSTTGLETSLGTLGGAR